MNELELYSFALDERQFNDEIIYKMDLPHAWLQYLESKKNGYGYNMIVTPSSMERKLRAIMPSIFYVNWRDNLPWLLSDEEVNPAVIKALFINWLAVNESCTVDELDAALLGVEMKWESVIVSDILRDRDTLKYNFIPSLMARKFAKEVNYVDIEGGFSGELNLKHTVFNGINECVSIPISETTKDKAFSYVFRFTYKTRGLMPESGILNVSLGTRRYLQRPLTKTIGISSRRRGSVLLGMKNPFETSSNIKSYMQLEYERRDKRIIWRRNVDEKVIDALNLSLDIQTILEDPAAYQNRDDYELLVVYSDNVFTSRINLSNVGKGIGLPEKSQLFAIVKDTFHHLKPLGKCKELKVKNKQKIGKDVLPLHHHGRTLNKIIMELWLKELDYDQIIDSLLKEEIVLFDALSKRYFLNSQPKIELLFIQKDATEIVKEVDNYKQFVRETEEVLTCGKSSDQEVISLIEIADKSSWAYNKDPKEALRAAFFNQGRLTQFIYPPAPKESEASILIRQKNSFFDLMKDVGCLPARVERFNDEQVILSLTHIIVNGSKIIPMITRYENKELLYKAFRTREWSTLSDTIRNIIDAKARSLNKYAEVDKIKSFYNRTINEVLEDTEKDVIVLADVKIRSAKNKFLINDQLKLNEIPFDIDYEEDLKRVKVVRINHTTEVPQYQINPKGQVKANKYQGIFRGPAGLYYSVGSRPVNMKFPLNEAQIYKEVNSFFLRRRNSEFIVLGAETEEERDELVILVNQLRLFTIAYENHTINPYPIHMVKSVEKYLNDNNRKHILKSISTEEEVERIVSEKALNWELQGLDL